MHYLSNNPNYLEPLTNDQTNQNNRIMKKFYTLILLTTLNFSFGQDPQLFNTTWYLQDVIVNGNSNIPPNSNMYLYFTSPTSFYTQACTSMSSSVIFDNNNTNFSASNYTYTLDMCFDAAAQTYQDIYFPFFSSGTSSGNIPTFNFTYTVSESENIKTLIITSSVNQQAIYSNINLSNDSFDKEVFSFYPNPSEDFIDINLNNAFTNNTTLEIYNEIGILHKTETLTATTARIDIKNLPSGIYFVKITTEKGTTVKKLIKK